MKTESKNIFRNIFIIIGILTVLLVIALLCSNRALMEERIDTLRVAGPYVKDTSAIRFQIIQNPVRAKEIRNYFQLDTLYADDADTWTKALAIGKFVAENIPHDNQAEWPAHVNAIGLWEYTKNVAPAFNCRLHSIMTFELLLAAGLDARYVTCMPQDENDPDCHVVNEVWLQELGKWAMVDTDEHYYATDLKGTPLSLKEIREHIISGDMMQLHPSFGKGNTRKDWYYSYMAKNTYWFSCWGELSYYLEDPDFPDVVRDHYYHLVPSGFEPFSHHGRSVTTSDAEQFWSAPVH